jgi:hypothetical protein
VPPPMASRTGRGFWILNPVGMGYGETHGGEGVRNLDKMKEPVAWKIWAVEATNCMSGITSWGGAAATVTGMVGKFVVDR